MIGVRGPKNNPHHPPPPLFFFFLFPRRSAPPRRLPLHRVSAPPPATNHQRLQVLNNVRRVPIVSIAFRRGSRQPARILRLQCISGRLYAGHSTQEKDRNGKKTNRF